MDAKESWSSQGIFYGSSMFMISQSELIAHAREDPYGFVLGFSKVCEAVIQEKCFEKMKATVSKAKFKETNKLESTEYKEFDMDKIRNVTILLDSWPQRVPLPLGLDIQRPFIPNLNRRFRTTAEPVRHKLGFCSTAVACMKAHLLGPLLVKQAQIIPTIVVPFSDSNDPYNFICVVLETTYSRLKKLGQIELIRPQAVLVMEMKNQLPGAEMEQDEADQQLCKPNIDQDDVEQEQHEVKSVGRKRRKYGGLME